LLKIDIDKNGDLTFLDTFFSILFEIPEDLIQIKRTVTDILDETSQLLTKK